MYFFHSGSDSTLISKGLLVKLNLKGATKTLKIRNVLNNEMSYKSISVNFFISLKQHPKAIPITNSWTVSGIELPINKLKPKLKKNGTISETLNYLNYQVFVKVES